jgi:hypothetical protein
MKHLPALASIFIALLSTTSAEARHRRTNTTKCVEIGGTLSALSACMGPTVMSGIVRASSGAVARVAAHATESFQCIVNSLERHGYPVRFMGGLSSGHMRNSLHHVGLALDVNQIARNVTKPRMPSNEVELANSCGLVSGAQWRNADSGHFQLGGYSSGRSRFAGNDFAKETQD